MKRLIIAIALTCASGVIVMRAQAPAPAPQAGQPAPPATTTADPYANNAAAGTTQFPLAAPAGKDSGAKNTAPPGSVNQGPFDPATWKYGPAFNPPATAAGKVWNPVKLKLQ